MAMTRTLWSISALAVEFDIDRRTVAKRINHIRHASKAGEAKQWLLADVVGALTNQPPDDQQDKHPFVDKLADRLAGWEEICSKPRYEVPLALFAKMIGQEPQIVLNQLRAGMPCTAEGNWSTGEGFTIATAPALDWLILVAGPVDRSGRVDLARELGL